MAWVCFNFRVRINTNWEFQIFVIILTLIFTGVNTWGVLQLKQDFDPNWYLRDGSHPTSFYKSLMEHFPDSGERSAVYFGKSEFLTNGYWLRRGLLLVSVTIHVHLQ